MKEVVSVSNGSSALRCEPWLAIWPLLVLLTGDEAFHTSMYPLSKEFGDLSRFVLEERGDRAMKSLKLSQSASE